jgi:TPR repeat protein
MYALGEGVAKDLVQAHFWLYSAYAREAEGAKETLALVESQMTDAQKAESMKLVRALFSKYKLPKASSQ